MNNFYSKVGLNNPNWAIVYWNRHHFFHRRQIFDDTLKQTLVNRKNKRLQINQKPEFKQIIEDSFETELAAKTL